MAGCGEIWWDMMACVHGEMQWSKIVNWWIWWHIKFLHSFINKVFPIFRNFDKNEHICTFSIRWNVVGVHWVKK